MQQNSWIKYFSYFSTLIYFRKYYLKFDQAVPKSKHFKAYTSVLNSFEAWTPSFQLMPVF